jgi:protein O-GlcNAc transferase
MRTLLTDARHHHQAGRLTEAERLYRLILEDEPEHHEALHLLGIVAHQVGRNDIAAGLIGQALAQQSDVAGYHSNLGNVLKEQGDRTAAVLSYRRALSLQPDIAETNGNLGNVLRDLGRSTEMADCYRRAALLKTDYAEARLRLAVASLPIVAETVPESLAAGDKFSGGLDSFSTWAETDLARAGKAVGAAQPFYLAYRPGNHRALLSRYGDLICRTSAAFRPRKEYELPAARPRVRLAIVSGQIRRHPVWDVILRGVIAHIDRSRFEILLYHTGAIADDQTEWARGHADRFVQGPKSVEAWLGEIEADRPDALFYPEIGMDPVTCALSSLRLAPLQIAGFGHPITTGLPTVDWFLSGDLLEGSDADHHYRERLLCLPGTGVCTQLPAVDPQDWGGPPRRPEVVRFALCHAPFKFDPADDALFAAIAKASGPCEFWLGAYKKFPWATERVHARLAVAFRAEGLDPAAHLRVMPWLPPGQFVDFLDAMDVYLDCPAFSGYTTAWQAIHRGLPIVTLEGEFLRRRLAAGLLRQIGATDGVVFSRDDYVGRAVSFAEECRDSVARAARRNDIRGNAGKADGRTDVVARFECEILMALGRAVNAPLQPAASTAPMSAPIGH